MPPILSESAIQSGLNSLAVDMRRQSVSMFAISAEVGSFLADAIFATSWIRMPEALCSVKKKMSVNFSMLVILRQLTESRNRMLSQAKRQMIEKCM